MDIIQQMGALPIFFIMFIIIYFLMIRPQTIQHKKHVNMLKDLKIGDKIITRGGMIGKIVNFEGQSKDIVVISINETNKIKILRSYIASLNI